MASTLPLGVEGRNCSYMCQQREGRRKYKRKQVGFFLLTPAGRAEGFSTVEKAEVRAQVTDGPPGLAGVSIRVSDELVWMFLKEGGVPEDRGNYF